MNAILSTILEYLFKGGLLSFATYYLGDIKRFVKSAMWQSVIQAIVLAGILFLLDRFLPQNTTPMVPNTPTTNVPVAQNQGGLENLLNMFNQKEQQQQQGGNCGCGVKTQMGGQCGVTAGTCM